MVQKNETENEVNKLIKSLKKFDENKQYDHKARAKIMETLVAIGKPAVPALIAVLNDHDARENRAFAADVLGEIEDQSAIEPLADTLENPNIGEKAYKALKKFGPVCIPEVIKRVEYRIAHPIKTESSPSLITFNALMLIGEIQSEQSSNFLNNLLDDYISEMPRQAFDPGQHEWKYRNVDFFHLLDCMVKQQNSSAIPHIRKARECFPKHYTDYIICQIAIGRIRKGTTEGFLPGEALEISMPSGMILDTLSGGEFQWEDTFDEMYGEYLDEE